MGQENIIILSLCSNLFLPGMLALSIWKFRQGKPSVVYVLIALAFVVMGVNTVNQALYHITDDVAIGYLLGSKLSLELQGMVVGIMLILLGLKQMGENRLKHLSNE